jgi:hypothetical protein
VEPVQNCGLSFIESEADGQLGMIKALHLRLYTFREWMLRKTRGVIRKLNISCQRRLRRVIKHVFIRTSKLLRTLKDALV